jgi:hypothetical protein
MFSLSILIYSIQRTYSQCRRSSQVIFGRTYFTEGLCSPARCPPSLRGHFCNGFVFAELENPAPNPSFHPIFLNSSTTSVKPRIDSDWPSVITESAGESLSPAGALILNQNMSRTFSFSARLALMSSLSIAICAGQTVVSCHVILQKENRGAFAQNLVDIVHQLDNSRLGEVIAGSWEEQNIRASDKDVKHRLRVDLSSPSGLYTLNTGREDVLVAHWDNSVGSIPAKAMWLWNAHWVDTVVFEVDPSLLQPNAFAQFLESVVIWKNEGGISEGAEFRADSSGAISGNGSLGNTWSFAAKGFDNTAFISISWDKDGSNGPLGATYVTERFPPLASRLKALSKEELFRELRRSYWSYHVREQIFIMELASRGELTDSDFRRLIFPAGHVLVPSPVNFDLLAVMAALERTNELRVYAEAITNVLLTTHPEPGVEYRGWMDAMNWLGQLHRAGIDSTDAALQLIRREEFTDACLRFLERSGKKRETMKRLSETPVAPRFQPLKDQILKANGYRADLHP